MKKFIGLGFLVFLLTFGLTANAQLLRYKATSFSVMEKTAKDQWADWSAFEPSTVVIAFDSKKNRIVINSQEIQLFKILTFSDPIETKTTSTLILNCVDNDGGGCKIIIVTHKNEDERLQFYVNYDDVRMVYNVYKTQ